MSVLQKADRWGPSSSSTNLIGSRRCHPHPSSCLHHSNRYPSSSSSSSASSSSLAASSDSPVDCPRSTITRVSTRCCLCSRTPANDSYDSSTIDASSPTSHTAINRHSFELTDDVATVSFHAGHVRRALVRTCSYPPHRLLARLVVRAFRIFRTIAVSGVCIIPGYRRVRAHASNRLKVSH